MSAVGSVEIIPVIDLKGGCVVRARAGDRDTYAPIVTPLVVGAAPVDVAGALLSVAGADSLYVADLDAIERRGDNRAAIAELARCFPQVTLWVDSGVAAEADTTFHAGLASCRIVVGSESQSDATLLRTLEHRAVLSLDYRGDTFLGPEILRDDPTLWPRQVIVMTLARVGVAAGPDLGRLAAVRRARADVAVYAAGGVRGPEDLAALADIGVTGALVATALHDGNLRRPDMAGPPDRRE